MVTGYNTSRITVIANKHLRIDVHTQPHPGNEMQGRRRLQEGIMQVIRWRITCMAYQRTAVSKLFE